MILLTAVALGAAAAPALDIVAFFTGRSHGDNVLKVALKRPVPLIVDSIGGKGDRGDFVLIETLYEGAKPARARKWIMKPAGPNHFIGTLTDATTPVDIRVSGGEATIRYTMKGGLRVVQQLALRPDGRTIANHIAVRKFGLKFASVDGEIRKLD